MRSHDRLWNKENSNEMFKHTDVRNAEKSWLNIKKVTGHATKIESISKQYVSAAEYD